MNPGTKSSEINNELGTMKQDHSPTTMEATLAKEGVKKWGRPKKKKNRGRDISLTKNTSFENSEDQDDEMESRKT